MFISHRVEIINLALTVDYMIGTVAIELVHKFAYTQGPDLSIGLVFRY